MTLWRKEENSIAKGLKNGDRFGLNPDLLRNAEVALAEKCRGNHSVVVHVKGDLPRRVERWTFDELQIDATSRQVFVGERRVELTRKEFDLLHLLASNAGRVVARLNLLQTVWGSCFEGSDSTVTVHIRRLRLKIEPDPQHPRYIETVWKVGYRLRE
jgi:DNA-binding response OmpR family regulator